MFNLISRFSIYATIFRSFLLLFIVAFPIALRLYRPFPEWNVFLALSDAGAPGPFIRVYVYGVR